MKQSRLSKRSTVNKIKKGGLQTSQTSHILKQQQSQLGNKNGSEMKTDNIQLSIFLSYKRKKHLPFLIKLPLLLPFSSHRFLCKMMPNGPVRF